MPSTYSNLLYHTVFSTKDRERLSNEDVKEELYRHMSGIVREEGGSLLEIGGSEEHVHLLAKFKPSLAVADMLRLIKTNSSKWMHEQKQHERFGWQEGYAAFSVSESQVVAVCRYIRNQAVHHHRPSFQEQFVARLVRNGVGIRSAVFAGLMPPFTGLSSLWRSLTRGFRPWLHDVGPTGLIGSRCMYGLSI